MKLLLLSSWPPYPCFSGGRQRTAATWKALQCRHQVTLLTFVAGPRERARMEELGALTLDYERETRAAGVPPSMWPFANPALLERLEELGSERFEATLFDQIFSTAYIDAAPGKRVLLEQNIESELTYQQAQQLTGPEKRLAQLQAVALRAYETRVWPKFDLRCVVSEHDADLMRARCPEGNIAVVPNGVDLDRAKPLSLSHEPRLLFVGALDYPPNVDSVRVLLSDIMPLVWERMPEMKVRIVGRNADAAMRALPHADPRIELHVNAPVLEALAEDCFLSVVPLRVGSGTRLKILEASAWGMPVVTTAVGCQGLSSDLVSQLVLADDSRSFADAVLESWSQPGQRAARAARAQAIVNRHYGWRTALEPLLTALEGLRP